MRFLPTAEQSDFARTLHGLLGASDVAGGRTGLGRRGPRAGAGAVVPARGDGPVRAAWADEAYDGAGLLPVELALGFVELGRAGMPGPVVETAAAAVLLSELARLGEAGEEG